MAVPGASTDPAYLLAMLNEQFVDAVDSGRVSPERAQALKPVLLSLSSTGPAALTCTLSSDSAGRVM